MWKRISSNLQTLAPWRSPLHSNHHNIRLNRLLITASSPSSAPQSPFQKTSPLFSANSAVAKGSKTVEEVMPIATGHEREEIEAELQGRDLAEMDHPEGPFGTKEAPAIIKSIFDKRIVGCPGGEGEDEHDVVWFWLEKGKPHECPVCTQYFQLEVVGPGGSPDGHDH